MNLKTELETRFCKALAACGSSAPAMVGPAGRPEFGDYQVSGVMTAAKQLKTNPRKLAEQVVAHTVAGGLADVSDLAEKVEIAGPGFINIRLRPEWIAKQLAAAMGDSRLGVAPPASPQTVVVDYSAPNLAKEMHVGHLRSTIIGDALARVLEFIGHKVVRQNHVGDWGTQFGMLVAFMVQKFRTKLDFRERLTEKDTKIADLEAYYRDAKKLFDQDPEFADLSRKCVVNLQARRPGYIAFWNAYRKASLEHCFRVYEKLGVSLLPKDIRGESFYGGIDQDTIDYSPKLDALSAVIADLQAKGMLTESQGAMCVFLDEFRGKDGEPLPLIVQKSDEGYLYATTDLAALRFRTGGGKKAGVVDWSADRILYVVDARQSLHFRQVFAVARKAGFVPEGVSLEHIGFGTMNGDDGKPFKTRTGGTVKLMDLLNEAEERAYALVKQKEADQGGDPRRSLNEDQMRDIARVVGIGGVKYADLSQNRTSDYVFSWDKMLSMEGNTAPYMQYAYARVRSIFRKGGLGDEMASGGGNIVIAAPAERALAVRLLQFPEVIDTVAATCMPNAMCSYLYDLAGAFMGFYENCPVLQAADDVRLSRLQLCHLTAETIKTGLDLLGIGTIEQM